MSNPIDRGGASHPLVELTRARLWEFVLPTSEQAVMCRRPLMESAKDSIRFTTAA
jgi:hypothetical protein